MTMSLIKITVLTLLVQIPAAKCKDFSLAEVQHKGAKCFAIGTSNYRVEVDPQGFRFAIFNREGKQVAPAHAVSGLQFGSVGDVDINLPSTELQEMTRGRVHDAESTTLVSGEKGNVVFDVTNTAGAEARVEIRPMTHRIKCSVTPKQEGLYAMLLRTAGIAPVYGLSDHGSLGRESAEISGYALKTAETGFPYTMTPLPLAYPDDPEVYGLANARRRSYQWLLGESLMAVPLYGDDYATAATRDVYLPAGRWIDYDTGDVYTGPTTLKKFPLPIGKTPLFVGGKGIVVEEEFGRLFVTVYPILNETGMTFHHRDGKTSRITVAVDSWEHNPVQVLKGRKKTIIQTNKRHSALVFPLEPGIDYRVESIPMPKPVSLVKPSKKKETLPQ